MALGRGGIEDVLQADDMVPVVPEVVAVMERPCARVLDDIRQRDLARRRRAVVPGSLGKFGSAAPRTASPAVKAKRWLVVQPIAACSAR